MIGIKILLFPAALSFLLAFLISKGLSSSRTKVLTVLSVLGVFLAYLGLSAFLKATLIGFLVYYVSVKIIKHDLSILGMFVSLLIIIQLYILFGLIIGPQYSLYLLYGLSLLALWKLRSSLMKISLKFLPPLSGEDQGGVSHYFFDLWSILFVFLLATYPQQHWDAVHANLYIARRYFETNSFSPLFEALSSLFPENGVSYFSFFYGIGGFPLLSISYVIPLITSLYVIRKLVKPRLLAYVLILTPSFIFQGSNAYYDGLVTACLLAGVYLLSTSENIHSIFYSMFLFGFATASKFFPALYLALPVLILIVSHKKYLRWIIPLTLIGLLPFAVWGIRSFIYTGSPIYPFFQNIFPTPHYWPKNDPLEQVAMIKTVMSAWQWVIGGFAIYPVLTYVRSDWFLEATRGFTTIFYILHVPVLLIAIIKGFKQPTDNRKKIILLFVVCAYIVVGLVTRYYRYIWPFQVTSFVFALSLLHISRLHKVVTVILCGLIIISMIDTVRLYGTFPTSYKSLGDSSSNRFADNDEFLVREKLNSALLRGDRLLDTSGMKLKRSYINTPVFQCNWYTIGMVDIFKRAKKDAVFARSYVRSFDYVVTNPWIREDSCQVLKNKAIADLENTSAWEKIYSNAQYNIYKRLIRK